MTSCRFCSFLLILSSTSRPTLSLQSLASASTSKSESSSKAAVEEEKAAEDAPPPPALLEVVVRMDSTLLPTGDARRAAAAAEGATEDDEAVTEGTGREDEPEAVATVESGRISWEPPGLSTEERMLKMENEGDRNVI